MVRPGKYLAAERSTDSYMFEPRRYLECLKAGLRRTRFRAAASASNASREQSCMAEMSGDELLLSYWCVQTVSVFCVPVEPVLGQTCVGRDDTGQ